MTPATLKNWTLATVLMAASALSQAQGPSAPVHHAKGTHQATATHAAKPASHKARHPVAAGAKSTHARRAAAKAAKLKAKTARHQRQAQRKAAKVRARQHRAQVH